MSVRSWKVALVAGAALVVLALAAWMTWKRASPRREARRLQQELRTRRAAVDSCRRALSQEEAEFREYDEHVDSLRERVERYEELHPDGVPSDSFDAYMEAFGRYNDAVPRWEARAESLRVRWSECRGRAEEHNELADTLRELLDEIGELPERSRKDVDGPGRADPGLPGRWAFIRQPNRTG